MARRNEFTFIKRQREIEQKRRKGEKLARRQAKNQDGEAEVEQPPSGDPAEHESSPDEQPEST
ncbi:MAG: hypothetical protein AB1486_08090 [Planctomycetota bacterium]